jgi:hypothetical protein
MCANPASCIERTYYDFSTTACALGGSVADILGESFCTAFHLPFAVSAIIIGVVIDIVIYFAMSARAVVVYAFLAPHNFDIPRFNRPLRVFKRITSTYRVANIVAIKFHSANIFCHL